MARILLTWELGAGLGHLQRVREIAAQLHKKHDCYVVLRELEHAQSVLSGLDVTILPAPFFHGVVDQPVKTVLCYADMLHNCGYHHPDALSSHLRAWQSLYDLILPDIMLVDHSPTALLAAGDYSFRKLVAGSGFICPPIESPLGVFFPKQMSAGQMKGIRANEARVLDTINRTLRLMKQAPLRQLSDIYSRTDKTVLTTLPALDHFPWRENAHYAGLPSVTEKPAPVWPDVPGIKIYAYLKPFKNLPRLLQSLKASGHPVLVYSNNINTDILESLQAPNIHFTQEAVDLQRVAKECDVAILNSNHGTTAELFLGAVPLVLMPLQKEQQILASRLAEAGCCTVVSHHDIPSVVQSLNAVLYRQSYYQKTLSLSLQQPRPTHGGETVVADTINAWCD